MDGAAGPGGARLDQLYAEATQLVSYATNQLRAIATRYREAYADALATLRLQREELDALDAAVSAATASAAETAGGAPGAGATVSGTAGPIRRGHEARRATLQRGIDATTAELGDRQVEQAKVELVVAHLERAWLFLQHGDSSLVGDGSVADTSTDLRMRIIEAQESERQRLAQEVHDGPAQALTNAIFQVEFIERMLERDPAGARTEIRYLRDLLRRELGDVRSFITQLRPPLLDEVGLYGAIRDHAAALEAATGASVELQLAAPPERLGDTQQTAVLRIVQEALQNVRRHAGARHVRVTTHTDGEASGDWVLEIADDGHGFDPDGVRDAASRSFGLRFMRERAELIGAHLQLESQPSAGTRVCVTIPAGTDRR